MSDQTTNGPKGEWDLSDYAPSGKINGSEPFPGMFPGGEMEYHKPLLSDMLDNIKGNFADGSATDAQIGEALDRCIAKAEGIEALITSGELIRRDELVQWLLERIGQTESMAKALDGYSHKGRLIAANRVYKMVLDHINKKNS